jgi:ubiquinone/menaquinone biosynthesis C-methylase UbiE
MSAAIEYGPGSGIYLPVLARHFAKVVAADVEQAYLAGIEPLVSRTVGLSLMVDDITNSKLSNESFGLVLCSEVLEHVAEPERAIDTLYRILQPGGLAVVTTPQRYSLLELCCNVGFLPGIIQIVRRIYREPVLETGHISLKTCGQFRTALLRSGFNILREEKFGLYVPIVAEFLGDISGRVIEVMERRVRDTALDWMLWTQAYVLLKPRV